jgi:hypothetical protein
MREKMKWKCKKKGFFLNFFLSFDRRIKKKKWKNHSDDEKKNILKNKKINREIPASPLTAVRYIIFHKKLGWTDRFIVHSDFERAMY